MKKNTLKLPASSHSLPGRPSGEGSWTVAATLLSRTAKHQPKYRPQDPGIKSSSFLWKVWWHLHDGIKEYLYVCLQITYRSWKKSNAKVEEIIINWQLEMNAASNRKAWSDWSHLGYHIWEPYCSSSKINYEGGGAEHLSL